MDKIGTPVKCKNCGTKWIRITPDSNPGGTVLNNDLQLFCPKCGSNWCEAIPDSAPLDDYLSTVDWSNFYKTPKEFQKAYKRLRQSEYIGGGSQ